MKTRILSVLAMAAFIASCGSNNEDNLADRMVRFASGVADIQTKVGGADGNQWQGNEAIGIYMVEHGQTLSATSIKESADNVKYTTSSTGAKATFTSTTPIYYPVNGPLVDFAAYHPYNAAVSGYVYPINLASQTDQSAIDLMIASANNSGAGYSKTNLDPVNLKFYHQLVKLVFNVTAGDGVANLTGLTVSMKGMNTTASYDLTGIAGITNPAGPQAIVPFSAGNNTYEAILLPVSLGANETIEFTVGGNTYVWLMKDNSTGINALEGGKKVSFDITLAKNKVQVTGTIETWMPINGGTGIAD